MTAIIGYDTFQNTPGLIDNFSTFHQGDPGLPVENLLDYATHTIGQFIESGAGFGPVTNWELSAPATASYVGFAGHNIPSGTTVRVIYVRPDDSLQELERLTTSGTGPQLLRFSQEHTYDYYRVRVELPDNTILNIGSMFLGRALDLPMGIQAPYTPPPLGRDAIHYPSTPNRGSNYLGGYVQRIGWDFTVQQNNLEPSWVNVNWLPLVRHLEQRPFFYLWDDQFPEDAVYGWAQGKIAPPSYTSALRMAFNIKCRGLHVS